MTDLTVSEYTQDDAYDDEARRRIRAVWESYQSDLDKLQVTLRAGGTILEMRAAVNAYDALAGVARELDAAMQRVLTPRSTEPQEER